MSDNKKSSELKNVVSRFASAPKPKKTIRASGVSNPVEHKKIEEAIRSNTGLSVKKARVMFYGSEESFNKQDSEGKTTRKKIRGVWDSSLNPNTEIQVTHHGGDDGQTYFIIAKTEYNDWYDYWIDFKPTVDSRKKSKNNYKPSELGLEWFYSWLRFWSSFY